MRKRILTVTAVGLIALGAGGVGNATDPPPRTAQPICTWTKWEILTLPPSITSQRKACEADVDYRGLRDKLRRHRKR